MCQECLAKERPYLNVEIDKDGKRARGKVCKLCDRKILVRQMLLKSQSEVSQKTSEQRKIMKQIEEEREQNRQLLLERQRNQWKHLATEFE